MTPTYATFRGDVSESIIGQIMGPDIDNKLSEAVEAEYMPLADLTRVRFEPVDRNDQREARPNEFGELRVVANG